MRIPVGFSESFLDWFRHQTEHSWSTYTPATFEDYLAAGGGGADWQRGTTWLGDRSAIEIAQLEHHWSIHFPPDYRRFLRHLHGADRLMGGARYIDAVHMVPIQTPPFRNWLTDTQAIQDALEWPLEGLLFDIEHNDVWLAG